MAEALPRSRCCCSKALSTASLSGMVTNLAMMGAGGDPLDWDGPGDSPFGLRRGNLWALIREIQRGGGVGAYIHSSFIIGVMSV